MDARVLGQLLLMQSVIASLPEGAIIPFVIKGLSDIPGIGRVTFRATHDGAEEDGNFFFQLTTRTSNHGELAVMVTDDVAFGPYVDHLRNFCFMIAVIIEERHQRYLIERHQQQLEQQVAERTNRLTAEIESHRQTATMLRNILDTTPDMVFVKDCNLRTIACNRAFVQALGKTHGDLIGRTDIENGWAPELVKGNPALGRRGFENDDHDALTGKMVHNAHDLANIGSEIRVFDTYKLPMHNQDGEIVGVLGISRDVTQRIEAERTLAESEALLRTIFEQAAVGVALIDSNTEKVLRINRRYCDLVGYSMEELLQSSLKDITHGDDLAQVLESMARLLAGAIRYYSIEKRYLHKNGSIVWVSLTISATWNPGEPPSTHIAVVQDITDKKRAEAEVHNLAFFDSLTQLPNRRLLQDRLQQSIVASVRSIHHRALLFLDIDNFKTINDTRGHDVGDRLLTVMAACLLACVREADTVSRFGGDEFVVLLEHLHENLDEAADQARMVSEKIIAALNEPCDLDGQWYRCSVSVGVTLFRGRDAPVDEVLKRADLAMYQAKAAGRNVLRFFDPHMQAIVTARSTIENELHRAITENEFVLHFQPQIDTAGQCLGVEALLRWNNPNRGLVPPTDFIPIAEESGLIIPIGQWVLERACYLQKAWQNNPQTSCLTIAVNVSARQFRQANFVSEIQALLQRTGADPVRIKLEITESLLLDDVDNAIIKIGTLKGIGLSFSLDDFGTGYSSLAYLKCLPLDQVKIDRSFIRDVMIDPNDTAICRAIIALGNSLGLCVLAEGVETISQWRLLESEGCHMAQGYLFGRPMPLDELENWLRARTRALMVEKTVQNDIGSD